jgi:hypothetical protein
VIAAEDKATRLKLVLSQVSEARPGAPNFLLIEAAERAPGLKPGISTLIFSEA